MEARSVSKLRHFPFPDYAAFRAARESGDVTFSALPKVAYRWAFESNYSSPTMTWSLYVPSIFLVVLVAYAAIVRVWLLLPFLAGWVTVFWLCRPSVRGRHRVGAWAVWVAVAVSALTVN